MKDEILRENLKSTLLNISELPSGFLKITHELADKFDLMDEVHGVRGIKTLCELLPKIEEYEDPLNINIKEHDHHIMYINTINKFFEKYKEEATEVATTETINFVEKVFPYISPTFPTHSATVSTIKEVCSDEYSAVLLKRLLNKYSIENQKELMEIANKVEDE